MSLCSEDVRQVTLQHTHKHQQTLVLPDGSAAAQEAQQEQHTAHGQDDVDPGEQHRVGRHDLPEAHRVHQHPDTHTQQEGAPQLGERGLNVHLLRQLSPVTITYFVGKIYGARKKFHKVI